MAADEVLEDFTRELVDGHGAVQLFAVYLIGEVRNGALALACLRRGLEARYARGVHELPAETAASFEETLVLSANPEELPACARQRGRGVAARGGRRREFGRQLQGQLEELVR